jgi:hypothetical protein
MATTRKHAIAIAITAVVACVAGIANGFAHDDIHIVLGDERLHEIASWPRIFDSPYWPPPATPDQYRPVTSILLSIQYIMGAGAPVVFRLLSYGLYAASAIAVYSLAKRLLTRDLALAVALVFAAHPVHVEATALAVGQAEIIVALCVIMAVVIYVTRREMDDGRLTPRTWATLAVLFVIAALSKEQGLMLPAFLLLAEGLIVRNGQRFRERVRSLWFGYAALAIVATAILLVRFAVLGAQATQPSVAEALVGRTFLGRVVTLLRIFPDWLRLLAWPAHLRIDYSPQEFLGSRVFGIREAFGLLLLLGTALVAWLCRQRARPVTFGIAWMGLALLPVSNVFIATGVLIAERTLFLPSVGFVLAVGGLIALGLESWGTSPQRTRVLGIACGVLVILGVLRSAGRQRIGRDDAHLTLSAIEDSPRSWRAQLNYGELLSDRGQIEDARLAYQKAIALAPRPAFARNAFAKRLMEAGDDRGAFEQLQLSLREIPTQVEATTELIVTLIALGRYDDARVMANQIIALENAPPVMVALSRLADSALVTKAPPGSIRVRLPPRDRTR